MNSLPRVFIIASLLITATLSSAVDAMTWPVISSISVSPNGEGSWKYSFSTSLQDIGNVPDPILYNDSEVMFGHKHYASSDATPYAACYDVSSGTCYVSSGKRAGVLASEVARQHYEKYGKNAKSLIHSGREPGPDECIAYYIFSGGGDDAHAPWSSVYVPGGMCTAVPPVSAFCNITTPELVLDHGTLSLQDAEGSSATTQLNVNCTRAIKVSLRLTTDQPYIYLTPSGKADITIDNKKPGAAFDLPVGSSTLSVKDVISGVTVGGQYIGSSVLVISPY